MNGLTVLGQRPSLEELAAMTNAPGSPTPSWERAFVRWARNWPGNVQRRVQGALGLDQEASRELAETLYQQATGIDPETGERDMPGFGAGTIAKVGALEDLVRFVSRPSRSAKRKTGDRTTVRNPQRKQYPDVYRDPAEIVEESAQQVAEEDPLLRQLFGVTRQDIDDIARQRYAEGMTLRDQPIFAPPKGGPGYVEDLMTPANTQRVQDVIALSASDPRFAGNYGWYETDPLRQAFIARLGPEAGDEEWRKFHAVGAAFSPGSDVSQEIRRSSIANMWRRQGEGARFLEKGAPPAGAGHAYHSTAHQMARDPLEGLPFEPGIEGAPKVAKYYAARVGENMDYPVGDAHWGRLLGLPDVRTAKSGIGGSPGAGEYFPLQNWYREQVVRPLDIPGVPAQALQWNAGATSTGVETAVGAPLLELIAKGVGNQAARTGKAPVDVLDDFIRGKGHLWSLPPAVSAALLSMDEDESI